MTARSFSRNASDSPAPARLVVRGVNWLGDAVMTTPALFRLREALPKTHLALLTHAKLADLWKHHPAVDEVLTFPQDAGLWSVARLLRAGRFDAALVLPNSPRSACEAWLAGIPRRVGAAWPWRNGFLTEVMRGSPRIAKMHKRSVGEIRRRLTDNVPPFRYPEEAHQLHHYLFLATAFGASSALCLPRLELTATERTEAARVLFERAAPSVAPREVWFGLNPGAEYGPAKRWPVERFIEVANSVARHVSCRWMVFGGPKERPLADQILAAVPTASSLCGQTTLRELMIGLSHCRLLLTNDTGPMHLSAALGTPVIAIFGSTSPELTGPGQPGDIQHRLLRAPTACAPCFRRECPVDFRCMNQVRTDQVIEAVLELAQRPPDPANS